MFWMSLLSYLTTLDLNSARNPDHSKLVSLGYSIASASNNYTKLLVRLKPYFIRLKPYFVRLKLTSSGWSLFHSAEAYLFRLKLTYSGWSVYPLTRNTSHASARRDPAGAYIVADVCKDNPDNINNYEPVLYEAHYCMVLLLQQCGLMLVNSCILKF